MELFTNFKKRVSSQPTDKIVNFKGSLIALFTHSFIYSLNEHLFSAYCVSGARVEG